MNLVVNCIFSVLMFNALAAITKAQVHHASNRSIDLLLGTSNGRVLKMTSNQTKELFGLTRKDEILGLLRNKNHLYILTDYHLHRCEFDWDKLELSNDSCTGNPFWRLPNAFKRYRGAMAIVEGDLHLGDQDGRLYVCDLMSEHVYCRKIDTVINKTISGMAYDSGKRRLYVSTWNATLIGCDIEGSGSRKGIQCDREVYKYLGSRWYPALMSVHVAYDAVWLGTLNGRLLKCDERSGKFECAKFDNILWTVSSQPIIYGFGSGNGYLYAALEGQFRNDLWMCQPDKPKSCQTTLQLPEDARSVLLVN